ncbi:hypothetical protein C8E01_101573 [Pontibacter virosus]|uniref:Uncharacterized protein n=1 Tax=Pontibacter virosus TaxID=1765052 RepID=A0A2U1B6Q6_9BACT|nr:hypothetical protein C8E01_101573 [Pontibacter virosus]
MLISIAPFVYKIFKSQIKHPVNGRLRYIAKTINCILNRLKVSYV